MHMKPAGRLIGQEFAGMTIEFDQYDRRHDGVVEDFVSFVTIPTYPAEICFVEMGGYERHTVGQWAGG